MKQSKLAARKQPVTRKPEPSTETPLTLEQVREAVEMAWTDATYLPENYSKELVCRYLQSAVGVLDKEIERSAKMSASGKPAVQP